MLVKWTDDAQSYVQDSRSMCKGNGREYEVVNKITESANRLLFGCMLFLNTLYDFFRYKSIALLKQHCAFVGSLLICRYLKLV